MAFEIIEEKNSGMSKNYEWLMYGICVCVLYLWMWTLPREWKIRVISMCLKRIIKIKGKKKQVDTWLGRRSGPFPQRQIYLRALNAFGVVLFGDYFPHHTAFALLFSLSLPNNAMICIFKISVWLRARSSCIGDRRQMRGQTMMSYQFILNRLSLHSSGPRVW